MKNMVFTFLLSISISANAFDEFLITDIRIVGLQRVSIGSIFTAIPVMVGDTMNQGKSLKYPEHYLQQLNLMIFKLVKMVML